MEKVLIIISVFMLLFSYGNASDADSLYRQGEADFQSGQFEAAAANMEMVLKAGYDSEQLYEMLADSYLEMKAPAQAYFAAMTCIRRFSFCEGCRKRAAEAAEILETEKDFSAGYYLSFLPIWLWLGLAITSGWMGAYFLWKRRKWHAPAIPILLMLMFLGAGFLSLEFRSGEKMMVLGGKARVLLQPVDDSPRIMLLKEGTVVQAVESEISPAEWQKMEYGGVSGWVRREGVREL